MTSQTTDLIACPDCDMLLQSGGAPRDREGHCPRCGALLWRADPGSSEPFLVAAICGLLLLVPALTLPVLRFSMAGQHGSNSLVGGVWRLWQEGEHLLAPLILLCSVVAPAFHLLLAAAIGLSLYVERYPRRFPAWLKWHRRMQSWSMLEVYAMGIIVAYVKMLEDGEVSVASGTYCLGLLLLCILLCDQYFREDAAWRRWEHRSDA